MKSLPQWSATVLLTAPVGAWALGLGDIELQSALNQPLRAEIELLSVTPEDLDGLRVTLASRATFERYELDLTSNLSGLDFDVGRNAAGRYVVTVTSRQPMADPFLTFLVEATWPRGRLLREYTVLLDPPIFTPEIGAEPPIRQAEAGASSAASGAFARSAEPAPAPSQPASRQAPAATQPAPRPAQTPAAEAALASGSYGPVQSSETLWGIASQLRPAGVTVNQMMVGLYETNPGAFDGNMNLLLRGATLTIPDRGALTARTAAEATAIVSRAEASWRGAEPAEQLASADPAPAASAPASGEEPRLRLVPPSVDSVAAGSAGASTSARAGGDGGSASGEVARLESEIAALRAELEESRRLLQLRDESLEALQARLAAADALPAPVESAEAGAAAPGVDLEAAIDDEPLFADELGADEVDAPAAEPEAAEPEPVVAEAAAAAAGTANAPVVRTTPQPEPSLVSRVLGVISNPLLLIGLGIGAVLLTAVWYLRNRREDADDVTGRWDELDVDEDTVVDEPAEPTRRLRAVGDSSVVVDEQSLTSDGAAAAVAAAKPKTDAEEIEDTLSSHTVINLDQGDILAEADFHMAYGLYDQAAELVQKALESEPDRRDLKLKLLEVFFVWGNKDAFRDAARGFRAEIGGADSDWDKVLIMGKQLCPDDALFAESTTAAGSGEVDLDLEGTGGSTEIDFPFDEKTQIADVDELDFELAATGERLTSFDDDTLEADDDGDDARADTGVEDMLDIGAQTAAGLEAALLSDDDDDDPTGQAIAELDPDDDTARASAEIADEDDTGKRDEPDFDLGALDDGLADSTDIELESLASTQESPTVESAAQGFGDDWRAALGIDDSDGNTDLDLEALVEDDTQAPTMLATANVRGPDAEPTVETAAGDSGWDETAGIDSDAPTMETPWASAADDADSPTIESPWAEAPTVETPTIEAAGPEAPTVETPTIESSHTAVLRAVSGETSEMPTVESSAATGEYTEEIELGDLGLSVEDLSGLPDDIGSLPGVDTGDTREQPALAADDDLLSATGVTEIVDTSDDDDAFETMGTAVLDDNDETLLAGSDMLAGGTQVLERDEETGTGATTLMKGLGSNAAQAADGDSGLDLDLDDLAGALSGGDTIEQPRAAGFESEIFAEDESTPVDLDVGVDEAPSEQNSTEIGGLLDPHTMTEIGTKLDLARAYIDMGDPEGARSILEEVLDEGDAGQRREAQGLIDALAG